MRRLDAEHPTDADLRDGAAVLGYVMAALGIDEVPRLEPLRAVEAVSPVTPEPAPGEPGQVDGHRAAAELSLLMAQSNGRAGDAAVLLAYIESL